MLSALFWLKKLRNIPWQVWAVLILVIGGFGIHSNAYSKGYAASETAWQLRVAEETVRQVNENEQALQTALAEIERLKEVRNVRNAQIERLNAEAATSRNADRESLDADSVLRLDPSGG